MKIKAPLIFALLLFLPSSRAGVEEDRAALRVVKTAYEEACKTGDLQKLAPHLSTNVTGVMVTGEEVAGFDGLQTYWAKIQSLMGPGSVYSVVVNVENTEFFGDTSLSRGATQDSVRLAAGRDLKFTSRWSAVCRKENGAWKLYRMQASLDPIQNVFIAARVAGAKLTYGIGGAFAGIAAAWVFIKLRRGNRPSKQLASSANTGEL